MTESKPATRKSCGISTTRRRNRKMILLVFTVVLVFTVIVMVTVQLHSSIWQQNEFYQNKATRLIGQIALDRNEVTTTNNKQEWNITSLSDNINQPNHSNEVAVLSFSRNGISDSTTSNSSVSLSSNDNISNDFNNVKNRTGSSNNNNNKFKQRRKIAPDQHKRIPHPNERIGPNGEVGYVHDPTYLRNYPRPFHIDDAIKDQVCPLPGYGNEGPLGYEAFQKIIIHNTTATTTTSFTPPQNYMNDGTQQQRKTLLSPKVFCSIYTYPGNIEQTNAIWETWGKRCDGYLFASTTTNLTTGHIYIPHTQSKHEGKYKGIWQKVRSMLAYIYDNFLDDYDYFHFCGDDTYLIVENLKYFLSSSKVIQYEKEEQHQQFQPRKEDYKNEDLKNTYNYDSNTTEAKNNKNSNKLFFAGFPMPTKTPKDSNNKKEYYLWGGSGYTMSREALRKFVEYALSKCYKHKDQSQEDVYISLCFQYVLNVTFFDTRDENDGGSHRYHQLPIERHATYKHPLHHKTWGISTNLLQKSINFMKEQYNIPPIYGIDSISKSSIAFHMLDAIQIRRYELLLYGTGKDQCQQYETIK